MAAKTPAPALPAKPQDVRTPPTKDLEEAAAEQHLVNLRALQLRLLAIQGDVDRQVAQLRMEGVSWARIAGALNVSAQAAHQRWSPEGVEKHRLRQRRLYKLDAEAEK